MRLTHANWSRSDRHAVQAWIPHNSDSFSRRVSLANGLNGVYSSLDSLAAAHSYAGLITAVACLGGDGMPSGIRQVNELQECSPLWGEQIVSSLKRWREPWWRRSSVYTHPHFHSSFPAACTQHVLYRQDFPGNSGNTKGTSMKYKIQLIGNELWFASESRARREHTQRASSSVLSWVVTASSSSSACVWRHKTTLTKCATGFFKAAWHSPCACHRFFRFGRASSAAAGVVCHLGTDPWRRTAQTRAARGHK